METCHRCGTVLPTAPGARYCPNCGEMYTAASDPTQAFAAVGRGTGGPAGAGSVPAPGTPGDTGGYPTAVHPGDSAMTWDLPPQRDPAQAPPAQPGVPNGQAGPPAAEPDPYAEYAELFRPPAGAARPNPNATQVMAPVAAPAAGYDQPAYDQPIDYQAAAGGGGDYSEPYDDPYADGYDEQAPARPRSSRAGMIGIGVAAGAILVIVVSLITLGGSSPAPAATPGAGATEVVTPTSPAATAPAAGNPATAAAPTTTAPTTSTPPTTASHPPGTLALGVTGADVKWLQTRLKQLHLYNGEISGAFDQPTQAAVVAFQARTHPADPAGIVGRSTKTALIAAGSKPALSLIIPGADHHGKGANPEDVKRLQRALSTALNHAVKATGQFDMDTFSAVVQYQSAVGLMPDGAAGDKVWSALQQGKIQG